MGVEWEGGRGEGWVWVKHFLSVSSPGNAGYSASYIYYFIVYRNMTIFVTTTTPPLPIPPIIACRAADHLQGKSKLGHMFEKAPIYSWLSPMSCNGVLALFHIFC
jgi:hypothetical protein